jgi:hypothetical protein
VQLAPTGVVGARRAIRVPLPCHDEELTAPLPVLPGHELALGQDLEAMTVRAIGKERLQRDRPPLDPLGDRKPLGNPGDDHGRPNAGREDLELAVIGDKDQIVLDDEGCSDGWVGEPTLPSTMMCSQSCPAATSRRWSWSGKFSSRRTLTKLR